MKRIALITVAAAALVGPATALGHVTVQPEEAPAGGFVRMDVRVPNEDDKVGTTKVEVEMPPGFIFASYEPVPGWDVAVKKRPTSEPIEAFGETYNEEVGTITWTGSGPDGIIPPDAFQDFGLSVGVPETPGEELTFKAIQTYENGEVVRWIGGPDSEEPAPIVTVTEAEEAHGDGHHDEESEGAEETEQGESDESTSADDNDSASKGLGIAALLLGGLGLAAGGASLVRSRNGS